MSEKPIKISASNLLTCMVHAHKYKRKKSEEQGNVIYLTVRANEVKQYGLEKGDMLTLGIIKHQKAVKT